METNLNIGLADNQRMDVADGLNKVLANTFVLYTKTHAYHWNVTGPLFQSMHTLLEEQYTDLFEAIDDLAERVRALGVFVPFGSKQVLDLATVTNEGAIPEAIAMARELASDHETVIRQLREVIASASEAGDEGTADMLTGRMEEHEKAAWMLRSLAA